jgi:hypothetical protein
VSGWIRKTEHDGESRGREIFQKKNTCDRNMYSWSNPYKSRKAYSRSNPYKFQKEYSKIQKKPVPYSTGSKVNTSVANKSTTRELRIFSPWFKERAGFSRAAKIAQLQPSLIPITK